MSGIFGKPATNTTTFNGLQIQTAVFGQPIPLIYGTTRLSGNIIDYIDFTQTSGSSGGGKGGGGKGGGNYQYSVAVAIGLCQGPINGIGRVWGGNSNTVIGQYNWSPDAATLAVINAQNYDDTGAALSVETDLTPFWGTLNQSPWSYMSSKHPERALTYPLLAYMAGYISLGDTNTVPDYSFEVFGNYIFGNGILDCNPMLPLYDALTNPVGGAFYPTQYLADMTNFSNYCVASGIFISPQITDSKATSDFVNEVMQCTNSQPVVSQGLLYFCPYGTDAVTGNGATYTPNLTPIYTLTDDDYLYANNEDPVKLTRESTVDSYNFLKVDFLNRADYYNSDIAISEDQAAVDRYGVRPADSVSLHHICDAGVAQIAANNILYRIVYPRNTYTFKTGYFPFCMLDPMDLIEINDSNLGLANQLVRIVSCDPDEQKEIIFTVEEVGIVTSGAAQYPRQAAVRSSVNYNVATGNVNPPVIFEAPSGLSQGNLETWIAASSTNPNWGGADIWVSQDGNTYKNVGRITSAARQGVLSATLPSRSDPDTTDTLSVNLTMSNAQLSSGTQADADNYNTICYVDGELISYETATLTTSNQYNLTYLRRGAYNTAITPHSIGSQFLRLDDGAVFKYTYLPSNIGQKIYIKLTSFNIFGGAEEELSAVQAYTHTINPSIPPDVQGLQVVQLSNGIRRFFWQFNYPDWNDIAGFEIRANQGNMPFWQNAIPLHSGVLTSQPFETSAVMSGTWSVMIKAVDTLGNYSAGVAYDIINLGPAIVDHLVYSANYYTQGWTGAKTNCFIDENGNLLANSPGTLMFSPNNNTPMFTSANAPMFSAQYGAITYVDSFKSPQAGQMSISLDCDGSAQIWYRSMYPQPMFTGANQPMFSGGANPMYTAGEWIPYTSKVAISSDTYQIMITISAGSLRPTIRTLTVNVDLPTVTESINSVAISASGTRLPITKVYNQILDINISIQSGSTSIGYQVIDYQTTIGAGPEIVLLNSSGVAVTGTVSVTIQGV